MAQRTAHLGLQLRPRHFPSFARYFVRRPPRKSSGRGSRGARMCGLGVQECRFSVGKRGEGSWFRVCRVQDKRRYVARDGMEVRREDEGRREREGGEREEGGEI
eukprot:2768859-Rhodomonas_salina.1